MLILEQSFLVLHLLLSAAPILLFLCFAISILLFSLSCAAVFSLFWISGALMVLIGFLLVSGFIGSSIWISGAGGFIAARCGYRALICRKKITISIPDSQGSQSDEKIKREKREITIDRKGF